MRALFIICIFSGFFRVTAAQSIEVIDTTELLKIINEESPGTKVINFWATWCKPCVEEMPYFEDMNQSGKAEVILVSLDFEEDIDTKVSSFIANHGITSRVCLLNNLDYNSWINHVDRTWTGSIPATLLINPKSGKRRFVENILHPGELDDLVTQLDN